MAFKKNSWLVRGVLILAVGAFVAVGFAGVFGGGRASSRDGHSTQSAQSSADLTQKLQGQIEGYKLVLEREPNNPAALAGIIDAQIQLGDLEGAVEPLERLAELNPETLEYSILLAQTKQQLGELEGAAQIYRRVLTQNPGSVPALEGLVALLISQERTEAAVGLLRDTLNTADQTNELAPGSVDKLSVKLLLGQVFVEQTKYDEALTIYDEAIADAAAASPTQPDFRPTLAKGLVLKEQGKDEDAQVLFDQALGMAPTQYKDGVQQLINQQNAPTNEAAAAEETPADESKEAGSASESSTENKEADDAPEASSAE
ncbi:MAG: tetratricopeptide repeat protein [Cyanobacteria bacterium P01_D01_bin.105]